MQFDTYSLRFRQGWLATLILLICVPVFIKLGLWQYHKAILKQSIQTTYTQAEGSQLVLPNGGDVQWDDWKYKKVAVKGHYETQYQILLDNQVDANRVGYHVITPLKLAGRDDYVLVNRGWVGADANRHILPDVTTPEIALEVIGQVWVPSKKIFTLESELDKSQWNKVWQHMDMVRYQKQVPLKLLPIVIKLDPASSAGGFVRNWQVAPDRVATHLGYAYQWFGFAVASILIYFYTGFRKQVLEK